jgi:hypothetical protein
MANKPFTAERKKPRPLKSTLCHIENEKYANYEMPELEERQWENH